MCLPKSTLTKRLFIKWWPTGIVAVLIAVFSVSGSAHAHKVSIFAWVDGDVIHTQSKFSGGGRVKHAQVKVYDIRGQQILEGLTDEKGEFTLKHPGKGPLRIVLMAAMGHSAHWTLSADELAGSSVAAQGSAPAAFLGKNDTTVSAASASSKTTDATVDIQAVVQTAVEKALDKKLKPIIELIVDARNPRPSFRDVIAGLGYILGLVGLGAYFARRRKHAGGS